jgi:hypothetical protein
MMVAVRILSVAICSFERVIDQRRPEAESSPKPPGLDINVLLSMVAEDLDQEGAVEALVAVQRAQAMLDALRLRLLERFPVACADDDSATTLLAGIEKISAARAAGQLALARNLRSRLPGAFASLEVGKMGFERVAQIARATCSLPLAQCLEVDAALLSSASEKTSSQLAHLLRKEVAKADPAGAARRSEKRKAERQVSTGRSAGGMSWLHALLDTEDTLAVYKRLDTLAEEVRSSGDSRTMNQLRADAVRDLLLGKSAGRGVTHAYRPPTGARHASEQAAGSGDVPLQRGGSHRSGRTPPSRGKAGRRGSRKGKATRGR